MYMKNTLPFEPQPNWRRNFEFKAAYTSPDSGYTLDPKLEQKLAAEFTLDPVLHRYSWPPKL